MKEAWATLGRLTGRLPIALFLVLVSGGLLALQSIYLRHEMRIKVEASDLLPADHPKNEEFDFIRETFRGSSRGFFFVVEAPVTRLRQVVPEVAADLEQLTDLLALRALPTAREAGSAHERTLAAVARLRRSIDSLASFAAASGFASVAPRVPRAAAAKDALLASLHRLPPDRAEGAVRDLDGLFAAELFDRFTAVERTAAGARRPLGVADVPDSARHIFSGRAADGSELFLARKAMIVVAEGDTVAGWFELAMCANFFLVTRHARLGAPEVKRGLTLPFGAHALTFRTGTSEARELMATGDLISGEEAVRLGIADELVPDGGRDAVEYALELCRKPAFHDRIRQTSILRQYGPPMRKLVQRSVAEYVRLLRSPETRGRLKQNLRDDV